MTDHHIDTEALRVRAEHVYRHGGPANAIESLAANTPAILDRLAAAEHRAARAEAQSAIRGRAVAIYQRRARAAEEEAREWRSEAEWLHKIESDDLKEADLRAIEAEAAARRAHDRAYKADLAWEDEKRRADQAEASRDEWRQTALDERGAALDALEQIKVRDARIKAVQDLIDQVKRAAAKAAWDEAIEEALDGWTIPASGDIEAVRYILLSTNPYIPEEAA